MSKRDEQRRKQDAVFALLDAVERRKWTASSDERIRFYDELRGLVPTIRQLATDGLIAENDRMRKHLIAGEAYLRVIVLLQQRACSYEVRSRPEVLDEVKFIVERVRELCDLPPAAAP